MVIKDLRIEKSAIVFSVDSVENMVPYVMKRISPDLWRYHDKRVSALKLNDNSFAIDGDTVLSFFDLGLPYLVCDIVCYDSYTGRECSIEFEANEKYKDFTAEIVFEKAFGSIRAIFYANASNSLSVRIYAKEKRGFHIAKMSEDENYINFSLKNDVGENVYKLYLARRENKAHDFQYGAFIELKISQSKYNEHSYFRVDKNGVFKNVFLQDKDIFDFIVISDNIIFPCYSGNTINTNYYSVQEQFEACCFNSENMFASIFIRGNYAQTLNKKIKVAILGSCFSKEAFHSLDYLNPDYKRFYENGLVAFHSSIISIVSKPVKYDKRLFGGSKDKKTIEMYGDRELSKTFINELNEYEADYMLADLYIEAAATIFEIAEDCYITDSFYFRGTSLTEQIMPKRSLFISSEERFEIFKQSCIKLRKKLLGIIPYDRIVLVKARRAIERIDDKTVSRWPEHEYIRYANMLWDRCDQIFERVFPEAKIIDMRNNKKYLSMKQSPLSFSPQHLVSEYYKDLLNKFNKIVLLDMLK